MKVIFLSSTSVLYQQFKKAVLSINPQLSDQEWEFLKAACTVKEYPKKSYFIQEDELQTAIGFINYGLIRGYYINEEGKEITVRFVRENGYVTHYSALINNLPSKYYFQFLEPAQLLLLPLQKIRESYTLHKGLERFGRLIAEQVLTFQQGRIEDFQFLSAEERYQKFITENPDLFNRVSLSHLSTYLGIQRPSLSRIRKKLAKG